MDLQDRTFTTLSTQRALQLLVFYNKLLQLHRLRATVIDGLVTAGAIKMSFRSPPRSETPGRVKLLVVRFLDVHLAQRGIEQHSYDMLYRMITLVSAMGKELHSIVQSKIPYIGLLKNIGWYADCILEGCNVFEKHFGERVGRARDGAERLPRLEKVIDGQLVGVLQQWRATIQTLHAPNGNDARLFRHMANHYDDLVYRGFIQLHRREPNSRAWDLNQQLAMVQYALESLCDLCKAADDIVRHLDNEFEVASKRLKRWARSQVKPIITASPVPSQQVFEGISKADGVSDQLITEYPPQLPPLPFQTAMHQGTVAGHDDLEPQRSDGLGRRPTYNKSFGSIEEQITHHGDLEPQRNEDLGGRPTFNKSFGSIEEQVTHRSHLRSATMADTGYTANPLTGLGLSIAQPRPRHPFRGPPVGVRRKGSDSDVPRIFTGSFNELKSDISRLQLHAVKTPEDQPSSPVLLDSPTEGTIIRDFADSSKASSMCPSPVTLLQRREALVSHDVQWGSSVVNGEVVRSRRPSDRTQRAHTIDDRTGGLEAWLSQQSPGMPPSPETPGSAVKRGVLRQRENTV